MTPRTIINYLHRSKIFEYAKKVSKPTLKPKHKDDRLEFARRNYNWKNQWHSVIFSDEKKFNLDNPDGYAYYWHDLRKDKQIFSKTQFGGGSVMIWGAIGFNGTSSLAFLSPKCNSEAYCDVLAINLKSFLNEISDQPPIFQQDNASIHRAGNTKAWLNLNNIDTLTWPAKSPDLNIIENVWGYLSRRVYANRRQFSHKNDLIAAIEREWYNID